MGLITASKIEQQTLKKFIASTSVSTMDVLGAPISVGSTFGVTSHMEENYLQRPREYAFSLTSRYASCCALLNAFCSIVREATITLAVIEVLGLIANCACRFRLGVAVWFRYFAQDTLLPSFSKHLHVATVLATLQEPRPSSVRAHNCFSIEMQPS